VPHSLRARHWDGFHAAMTSGVSRNGACDLLKVPALTKDGGSLSIVFTITMLRAPGGRAIGTVAVIRDGTAAFAELRALRQRLRRDGWRRLGVG
jgi:hypothetical protein